MAVMKPKKVPLETESAVAEETPAAEARGVKVLRAVYGLMVDPTTGVSFSPAGCVVEAVTPWMQNQIDAGKLEWL